MTDVLLTTSMYDAKRSSLYMPFDVVLQDSYAGWYKVSCESVETLMIHARCNAFAIQADAKSMYCFFAQARGLRRCKTQQSCPVLGMKQPIIVPHHNDR